MSENIHNSMSAADDGRTSISVDEHFVRAQFTADACIKHGRLTGVTKCLESV